MQEERIRILEMLEKGQITAREAEDLLDALGVAAESPTAPREKVRRLCIRITDLRTGKVKTNVNVPLGMWGIVGKMTNRFVRATTRHYMGDIQRAARQGSRGTIVDVSDENRGERVEIFVE